jgi:hypothetical protein
MAAWNGCSSRAWAAFVAGCLQAWAVLGMFSGMMLAAVNAVGAEQRRVTVYPISIYYC